ncbi:alpha/beta fold hydrolase [Marinobacterium arenosum]|uniref:alpha/beta fold hydrolase n=1 Tax=Marinobacterium arenosum TaxID=2862496 RepID=UPI001C97DDCE|nr:alpha/beta fold hydrolase [Marinobacterium arenosum]MBY4678523.1 alpha/beta fold hydrolase [Marinobacterium arenosum]
MQLNHQIHGSGQPLIILHGLFGTLENWGSQIKTLAEHYRVIAVDLRNHGRSPHSEQMDYASMAQDIVELMDQLELPSAHLLGHSMGGKVAMQLALNAPERIDKLIVVDIAPVQYPAHHDDVFKGLFAIDLAELGSRGDADRQLAIHVEEPSVRAFLLKNLYRTEQKQFAWRMNLASLHQQYGRISEAPSGDAFQGPTLFIKGANSDYLVPAYRDQVVALFPSAGYKMIDGAGHWPHAEKPAQFSRIVLNFLAD